MPKPQRRDFLTDASYRAALAGWKAVHGAGQHISEAPIQRRPRGGGRVNPVRQRGRQQRQFPSDNATVSGEPGYAKQGGDRTQVWWGRGKESEIVTNDGVNAAYVRIDGMDIVDEAQDDPYDPHPHQR